LLIAQVARDVISPSYQNAKAAASALSDAVQALPPKIAAADQDALTLVDQRFKAMVTAWQGVEVMQLGPTGSKNDVIGGQDLRDEIYSWPTTNYCLIDQVLVNQSYDDTDFLSESLVNVRGLDALEYVLYNDSTENQCDARAEINNGAAASTQWSSLSIDELNERRRGYAKILASDLSQRVSALAELWSADGGRAYDDLLAAGDPGSSYNNVTTALNDLTHALFYIEEVTKDKKLGEPGGLCVACQNPTWEKGLEFPWAKLAAESIAANLRGVAALYFGQAFDQVDRTARLSSTQAEGNNFDATLRRMGDVQLADDMVNAIGKAIDVVDNIPRPVYDNVIMQDGSDLETMYNAVKDLADLLKGDFATVLLLEVPAEAASDAD